MSIEVKNKLRGKIVSIKGFGTFVELPKGKSGLVHISEVAGNYIENVEDRLSVGDEVGAEVLPAMDGGKVSLSIKRAENYPREPRHSKANHGKPVQKTKDLEKKLSNFLEDSEDKLTPIKHQTESRGGDRNSRRQYDID